MRIQTTFEDHYRGYTGEAIIRNLAEMADLINYEDSKERRIFEFAIIKNNIELIRFLLNRCGHTITNKLQQTPLIFSAGHGEIDGFNIIMNYYTQAELLITDYSGWNALHHAVNHNKIEHAVSLISRLSTPDLLSKTGRGLLNGLETALHLAAMGGFCRLANILLDKAPALLEIADKRNQTPLHLAIIRRKPLMVKLLLVRGADPTITQAQGQDGYALAQENVAKERARPSSSLLADTIEVLQELEAYRTNPAQYRQQAAPNDAGDSRQIMTAKCVIM